MNNLKLAFGFFFLGQISNAILEYIAKQNGCTDGGIGVVIH